jgi:hypothetical protein
MFMFYLLANVRILHTGLICYNSLSDQSWLTLIGVAGVSEAHLLIKSTHTGAWFQRGCSSLKGGAGISLPQPGRLLCNEQSALHV